MVITKQQISQKHGNYIAQQKYPGYMVVTKQQTSQKHGNYTTQQKYPGNMVITQHNKNIPVTW